MTVKEISNTRLCSQKVASQEFNTPKDIVRWMGAMQAQDYSMAKWAIGVRLAEPVEAKVEAAFDRGDILRTHLLRPTWHFVSADDIYWILDLSAPKIKSTLKLRHKRLELDESVITKTRAIIEKSLLKESSLTREQFANEFKSANIRTDGNRLSHILFGAEMDGIVCSGPLKERKLTYSLLNVRVPVKRNLTRDEALAELGKRYFNSRCPATLEDFLWWSNLSVSEGKKALDYIKSDFFAEIINNRKYWFPISFSDVTLKKDSVHLLPAYDEFLISYRDRSASLSSYSNKKIVSDNGIFYPTIIVNGQVAGLWKRTFQKNKVNFYAGFLKPPDKTLRNLVEKKAGLYGQFMEREISFLNTKHNK
jgi:hypothetical protein